MFGQKLLKRAKRQRSHRRAHRRHKRFTVEALEPRLLLSHCPFPGHKHCDGGGGNGGGGDEEPFTNPAFVYELHGRKSVDLYLTTSDGSVTEQLTKTPKGDDLYPTWSPDGTKIAFRRDNDLYTVNADGTGLTQIYKSSLFGVLPGRLRDWSPDGSMIVFDDQAQTPIPYEDIYFFDVDNNGLQSLKGDLGATELPILLDDPVFSPDLDSTAAGYQGRLAFSGFTSGVTDERDLGLLDITISTTGVIQPGDVTMFSMPGTQTVPSWSPDGQFLTYTEDPGGLDGGQTIQLLRLNENQIEEIQTLVPADEGIGRWERASWSPDGQWVGFVKSFDVFRIRPDGTELTSVITTGNRNEASIDWNPAWVNDIDGALRAESIGPGVAAATVTPSQVEPLLRQALNHWKSSDHAFGSPHHLNVNVVDLSGTVLGMAANNTIWIDSNAAGHGWFVDAASFPVAVRSSAAAGQHDLFTVLLHEVGHLYGHDHSHSDADLMSATLPLGKRWLPGQGAALVNSPRESVFFDAGLIQAERRMSSHQDEFLKSSDRKTSDTEPLMEFLAPTSTSRDDTSQPVRISFLMDEQELDETLDDYDPILIDQALIELLASDQK